MSKEGQLYSMLLLPAVEEQNESPSFFSIMLYFDQVPLASVAMWGSFGASV